MRVRVRVRVRAGRACQVKLPRAGQQGLPPASADIDLAHPHLLLGELALPPQPGLVLSHVLLLLLLSHRPRPELGLLGGFLLLNLQA